MDSNVRQRLENNEKLFLSDRAALACESAGRVRHEEECTYRTCYQRDRDRIIHSKAFRRLKHKTQVFLAPEGDHYRTRLTHTLEVGQIARTIARALALNEDLTEAISMGHDLGHTPFGHAGERALNRLSSTGFQHYRHSIRVVEKLEKNGAGLNLTLEVKNGIFCHTKGEEAKTLEGRIVRLADKIAYINHDIDDAIRAGVLLESDLPAAFVDILGHSKSSRINCLVKDVVENSGDDIRMSDSVDKAFFGLHEFMFDAVYTNPVCKGEEGKAEEMLSRLFEYFEKYPDMLPEEFQPIYESEGSNRAACDYIAGMSDFYALGEFKRLFIPFSWS